ncbi:hypothetical protein HOH87_02450 [bacterium]|jgi:hypothetical protein|nr:hypothetical protein [bacterium]
MLVLNKILATTRIEKLEFNSSRKWIEGLLGLINEDVYVAPRYGHQTLDKDFTVFHLKRSLEGISKIEISCGLDQRGHSHNVRVHITKEGECITSSMTNDKYDQFIRTSYLYVFEDKNTIVERDGSRAAKRGQLSECYWARWTPNAYGSENYSQVIYPSFRRQVLSVLSSVETEPGTELTILDLCGGRAILANQVLGEIKGLDLHINYVVADRLSHEIFSNTFSGSQFLTKQNTLYTGTNLLGRESYDDLSANKPVQLIISCGGLLNEGISPTKKDALSAAHAMYKTLEEGGYLMVSGQSPIWLNKDNFESVGFRVRHCIDSATRFPFYTLQKSLEVTP